MTALVLHGDCLTVMPTLAAESVDAVVCDPPYELGFMGKRWDATGVAFQSATWTAALRVAKPGAHLVACGSPRTYHRLAVAIEDAGWEIRALHIDACRIEVSNPADRAALEAGVWERRRHGPTRRTTYDKFANDDGSAAAVYVASLLGRWPANVVLLDAGAVGALDRQPGTQGPHGSASRYFATFADRDEIAADRDAATRFLYMPKAPRAGRDAGITTDPRPRRRSMSDDARGHALHAGMPRWTRHVAAVATNATDATGRAW